MNVIRRWYRVPAAAGTSVDSALRGRGIWLEGNAVGNRRIVRAMHDARETGISKQRRSGREVGAGHRTVAVTATIWIGWGFSLAVAFASNVVASEFAHDILTVMAVLIAVVVMAVVTIGAALTDHMLLMFGYGQMQVNAEGGRQRRQDRHCNEQVASA